MLPECPGVSAVPGEQQQERGAPDGKRPGVAGAKDGWSVRWGMNGGQHTWSEPCGNPPKTRNRLHGSSDFPVYLNGLS